MSEQRTELMAVVNITPDSLYGGVLGQKNDLEEQLASLLKDGADIVDVGGESTAPDSKFISAEEEWQRIEPALTILKKLQEAKEFRFKISIDTYKSTVLEKAFAMGVVDMLNDVSALRGDEQMAGLAAKAGVEVCLMYANTPLQADGSGQRTSNDRVEHEDVIKTIGDFWQTQIDFALNSGIAKNKIILDPGMGGFVSGDPAYSFVILDRLEELKARFKEFRILVGPSRKGFVGMRVGSDKRLPVEDRLEPSLAAAALAAYNGADIIRAHDVAPTRKALDFIDNFQR